MKKLLKSINYRKTLPNALALVLFLIVIVMLYSVIGQIIALFRIDMYMTAIEAKDLLPYKLGVLLPYSFYEAPEEDQYILLVAALLIIPATWAFSTRIKLFTKSLFRRWLSFVLNWGTIVLVINYYLARAIKYIGYDKVVALHEIVNEKYHPFLNRGALEFLGVVLMLSPVIVTYFFVSWIWGMYKEDRVLQEWFKEYRYEMKLLGRFGDESAFVYPDIQLAVHAELRTPVVLSGDSRQLGTLLIGPPGSGKTALKISNAFQQDLNHLQRLINDFPTLIKKYGYGTKEFQEAWGKYLAGSIVIEPSKDLCDTAYQLAIDHGIPEEFITYYDPSNPDTPSFNCMIGPISQIAETITAVLDGMSESTDDFFRQACRTVVKMYIYLLKIYLGDKCSLLDLDRMYQDPRFSLDMVEAVEKMIPDTNAIQNSSVDDRIYWMLVQRVIRWFRNDGLGIAADRNGVIQFYPKGHEHEGKAMVLDKQAEFTRQTRNLLSDLIMNPYLARILIGDRMIDLDRLMEKGGILLCNTDNGLLGDISDAFGKLVLMSAQNAVFRRKGTENTRALISAYVDEFYDYMNLPFLKLAGQGRKYKFAPYVACQSLSQFSIKFSDRYIDGMLGTIRNLIVYGGVSSYDAEMLTKYLGTQEVEELSVRENITPDQMDSPNYSYSETATRKMVEVATVDDIMFNPFKYSYIRMVQEKSTKRAIRAEGDFVDFGASDQWKKNLNPKALELFMEYWRRDQTVTLSPGEYFVIEDESQDSIRNEMSRLGNELDREAEELRIGKETRFITLEESNVMLPARQADLQDTVRVLDKPVAVLEQKPLVNDTAKRELKLQEKEDSNLETITFSQIAKDWFNHGNVDEGTRVDKDSSELGSLDEVLSEEVKVDQVIDSLKEVSMSEEMIAFLDKIHNLSKDK